jgi:hypothetical protein
MFYAESQDIKSGEMNIAEIRAENVFAYCSECEETVHVNFVELIARKDFDLCETDVLCEECAGKSTPFAFVPKEARGCMTDEELDDALSSMNLSTAEENAVREVCRKGFVIAPELKMSETDSSDDGEADEYDVDKCLAKGKYADIAREVFYSVLHVNQLLHSAILRAHRLERLTSLNCPDIITTNEAKMAREKIEAMQIALDEVDEDLRKLQLKTDARTKEERLLDAVFGKKGAGCNEL